MDSREARKTLETYAMLGMAVREGEKVSPRMCHKNKKPEFHCRVCDVLVDVKKLDASWAVGKEAFSWVCSEACKSRYEGLVAASKAAEKKERDIAIRRNMKKFGKGFK